MAAREGGAGAPYAGGGDDDLDFAGLVALLSRFYAISPTELWAMPLNRFASLADQMPEVARLTGLTRGEEV